MDRLFEFSRKKISQTSLKFTRYMFNKIKWEGRMLGIVGPRGVGKTTLMLQHIKKHLDIEKTLYISADQIFFNKHSLLDVADYFNKMGGTHLFIDEIHKYPTWSAELKQIYDSYEDMHIVFSGSSILDIFQGAGDLSRRAPIYEMQGLSFREYLNLFQHIDVPTFTLEQVISNQAAANNIDHILPYFKDYLKRGYYPFANDAAYEQELLQVVTNTMETDIPHYASLNISAGRKLQRLMMVVADSVPFKPQMSTLAQLTGISRNDMSDYLYFMERAGMIAQLRDNTQGVRGLGKTEKIYLDNTNLAYILSEKEPNIGNIRETFFYNQTRLAGKIRSSSISDFEIEGRTFEVGGHNKGKRQIENASDGYIVKDDIEYGHGNIIPLWAFGLMY